MKISNELKENDTSTSARDSKRLAVGLFLLATAAAVCFPVVALASVEGSLYAVYDKLVGTLLPLSAICGLVLAGFSFVAGLPNARQHLFYAIIGAIVGFGAESIVSLIRSLIH